MDVDHLRHIVASAGEDDLADVCVRLGYATRAELKAARAERAAGQPRLHLGQILVRRGVVTGAQLAEILRYREAGGVRTRHAAAGPERVGERASGGLPDRIGKYRIDTELGRGGMAVVYRGHDSELDRTVAVKVMLPRKRSATALARFRREARAAGRLRHPNIVRVLEYGVEGGRPFLVLEYVEGRTLADELERGRFSRVERIRIVRDVALAVQHAHERGVVHRDLKPRNVLLDDSGRPRVADFGLARLEEGVTSLTSTDEWVGTPLYMAPEQVIRDHRGVGPWTDIYALGAILYECVHGVPPFQADSTRALFAKILREQPDPSPEARAGRGLAVEAVYLRALDKDSARRHVSALEFARDLERVLGGSPLRRGTRG